MPTHYLNQLTQTTAAQLKLPISIFVSPSLFYFTSFFLISYCFIIIIYIFSKKENVKGML